MCVARSQRDRYEATADSVAAHDAKDLSLAEAVHAHQVIAVPGRRALSELRAFGQGERD